VVILLLIYFGKQKTTSPSPKIDFSCSVATAHLQWLERGQISSDNFTK
jgi:hypothetical protein